MASDISEISSRKSVPPLACSKRPSRLRSGRHLQGKSRLLLSDADLEEILAGREILPRRIEDIGAGRLFPVHQDLDFPPLGSEERDLDPWGRTGDAVG